MFHLVLNSFVYTNCISSNGRPLSSFLLTARNSKTLAKGRVFKTESSQFLNIATFKHAAEGEIRQVRSRISRLSLTNLSSML